MQVQKVDRFVVPRGQPAPAAFVVDHLYVAHNLRERLAWPVHRAIRGRGLVRTARTEELTASSLAAIADAARVVPGAPELATSWIVDTDYRDSARDRSIVFVFSGDDHYPALVIKRAPVCGQDNSRSLSRERHALEILRRMLPDAIARTVPQVLAHEAAGGWESLAVTWLPGRSAYAVMHTRLVPAASVAVHFRNAALWLARFHDATRVPGSTLQPAQSADAVRQILLAAGRASDFDWFARLCESCAADPVPAVTSQGDFWARNVLFGRHEGASQITGVVDWEQSCEGASPFEDLFHFAITYGLSYPWSRYRRASPVDAFRRTFLLDNHVSREVRGYLHSYCRERGLDPRRLGWWFRVFLLARAQAGAPKGDVWIRFDEMLAAAGRSVFSG